MAFMREVKGTLQVKNNMFYVVLDLPVKSGKRRQKWISTGLSVRGNKRKAEEALQQLKTEYTLRESAPKGSYTDFLAYIKSWLDVKKGSIQETTYESYRDLIYGKMTRYFEPLALRLQEVDDSVIEKFFEFLYENGLKPNTVVKYYAVLMTFFRYAKKKKAVESNPMEDVDKPTEIEFTAAFAGKTWCGTQKNQVFSDAKIC